MSRLRRGRTHRKRLRGDVAKDELRRLVDVVRDVEPRNRVRARTPVLPLPRAVGADAFPRRRAAREVALRQRRHEARVARRLFEVKDDIEDARRREVERTVCVAHRKPEVFDAFACGERRDSRGIDRDALKARRADHRVARRRVMRNVAEVGVAVVGFQCRRRAGRRDRTCRHEFRDDLLRPRPQLADDEVLRIDRHGGVSGQPKAQQQCATEANDSSSCACVLFHFACSLLFWLAPCEDNDFRQLGNIADSRAEKCNATKRILVQNAKQPMASPCHGDLCIRQATTDVARPFAKRVTSRSPAFSAAASLTTEPSAAVVSE